MAPLAHPQIVEAARLVPVDHRCEIEPRVVCSSFNSSRNGDGQDKEWGLVSALTGLRAIAANFVVLFHYGSSFANSVGVPYSIGKSLSNGYLGVSFFFVLSGFILAYSYRNRLTTWSAKKAFFLARLRVSSPGVHCGASGKLPDSKPIRGVSVDGAVLQFVLLPSWVPYTAKYWNTPGWTLSVVLLSQFSVGNRAGCGRLR
jgi:hypothetical protein